MKVLVTGASGQLGYDCMRELALRGIEAKGVSSKEFPLTDTAKMREVAEAYAPDAVLHCAAWTAVDKAEDEKETCEAVNAGGTRALAEICRDIHAKMLYISTDYVFPGTGLRPYMVDDHTAPCNAYGLSKLHGEEAVRETLKRYFIVRISWVFGIHGKNFVRTMLKLSETHDKLTVVDDQVGSPTYTRDLASLLVDMIGTEKYGTYHATNEGFCSWAEFAREIFRQAGRKTVVEPVSSTAYPTKAVRPKNSRLSKEYLDAAGFKRLPVWQDAVGRYLIELAAEKDC